MRSISAMHSSNVRVIAIGPTLNQTAAALVASANRANISDAARIDLQIGIAHIMLANAVEPIAPGTLAKSEQWAVLIG